jgi:cytochrome c peroxidase
MHQKSIIETLNLLYMKKSMLAVWIIISILFQYCSGKDAVTTNNTTANTNNNVNAVNTTTKLPTLPSTPYAYASQGLPSHIAQALQQQDNTPADNQITDHGATLGRVLFYDVQLSKTNTISCASCHQPSLSFSDSSVKSKGFAGGLTARHSMPLLNLRFYKSGKMFWDERAASLEQQVLMPIQDLTEMGLTLDELQQKVATQSYYPALFQNAFGTTQVTSERIAKALAQFLRSIVTTQAKYDLVKQGQAQFTPDEAAGENLFLNAGNITCASCHTPPMFITSAPAAPFGLADAADQGINGSRNFKSGSLRNIANTAPYFHNGSIASLQSMLAGTNGAIPQHTVAPQDRQRLLAFMQTLTDGATILQEKYANPFK